MSIKLNVIAATCLTSLALIGCSDSNDDDKSATTDMSAEVIAVDTAELKSIAVRSLGGQYDGNAEAITTVANQNSEVVTGTIGDVAIGGTETFPEPVELELEVEQTMQSIIAASLGTSEVGNSTTTRNGNTITIDPDETEVCAESEDILGSDPMQGNQCELFMQDVTVELFASSEESGVVTYRYRDEDVLKLGYGEGSEYSEIDLGGLRSVLGYAVLIDGDEESATDLPSVMTGSMRFTASIDNETLGSEAGSLSYDIIKPIQIVNVDEDGQTDISLEPGNLFSISANAATGAGSLSFDVGAISVIAPSDRGIARMNLAGYTGSAQINPENGELRVSNLGLSKGPLSISLDNTEVLRMTLGAFGFNVTEGTDLEPGEVIIDGNMDLSVALSSIVDFEPEADVVAAALNIMMPSGTSLYRAPNGQAGIGGVGPLSVSYSVTNTDNEVTSESISVNTGECFEFPAQGGTSSESDDEVADFVPSGLPGEIMIIDGVSATDEFTTLDQLGFELDGEDNAAFEDDSSDSLVDALNASAENCL